MAPMKTPTATVLAFALLAACGDSGAGNPTSTTDTQQSEPQPLGATCRTSADCISRVCLTSQYGTPFCTRSCESAWEPCEAGDDLQAGQTALCVSFEDLPNPDAPPFEGTISRFCALRCSDVDECTAVDPAWETCERPMWLGNPLNPGLGNIGVCQSPSFHGKEPIDPSTCDWDRLVRPQFSNEANLCVSYCDYLNRCKELESTADIECCQWGCYNQIVVENAVEDGWRDEIMCYIQEHAAYPDTGPVNSCTEPPKHCFGDPTDPTPPAARPPAE